MVVVVVVVAVMVMVVVVVMGVVLGTVALWSQQNCRYQERLPA